MSFFALHRATISGLQGAMFFSIGATIYRSASVDIEAEVMNLFRSTLGFLFFVSLVLILGDLSSILLLTGMCKIFSAVFFSPKRGSSRLEGGGIRHKSKH